MHKRTKTREAIATPVCKALYNRFRIAIEMVLMTKPIPDNSISDGFRLLTKPRQITAPAEPVETIQIVAMSPFIMGIPAANWIEKMTSEIKMMYFAISTLINLIDTTAGYPALAIIQNNPRQLPK